MDLPIDCWRQVNQYLPLYDMIRRLGLVCKGGYAAIDRAKALDLWAHLESLKELAKVVAAEVRLDKLHRRPIKGMMSSGGPAYHFFKPIEASLVEPFYPRLFRRTLLQALTVDNDCYIHSVYRITLNFEKRDVRYDKTADGSIVPRHVATPIRYLDVQMDILYYAGATPIQREEEDMEDKHLRHV